MAQKEKKEDKVTPLMKQYNGIKSKYPDALLLFRVGDFYETFGSDAVLASKILEIVLTNRANGSSRIELAGFPHHALDNYLPKLVRAGHRVAICDQLEDPKKTKKIVKRGVTELVTPGVSYNHLTIDSKKNNYISSIFYGDKQIGVSFLDISTGDFFVSQGDIEHINKLIQSLSPSEILYQKSRRKQFNVDFDSSYFSFPIDDWPYTYEYATELLLTQFKTKSLKGFGIENLHEGIISSGIILHYLKETKHEDNSNILSISRIEEEKYLWMDKFTIRNLELFFSPNQGAKTLIQILDQTETPMGSRMISRWLALPLKNKAEINKRLEIVNYFNENDKFLQVAQNNFRNIGDLERLVSKVSTRRVNPREVQKLKESLNSILPIKEECEKSKINILQKLGKDLDICSSLINKIENEIVNDPPAFLHKLDIIKRGVDSELDELKEIKDSAKNFLEKMRVTESEKTGIPSLKISYNNVFGYYLEVRNIHKDKVPQSWIRKQTLVNAERYITAELKEYESKIMSAQERIGVIEYNIYNKIIDEISEQIIVLKKNANIISFLDCLLSFSKISTKYNYVKPVINNSSKLRIIKGRHPVIEQQLEHLKSYIPNDIILNQENQQLIMITGPNMSGKSAILRQTALIVLMAQIGCFVPAENVEIGIVDKIFTRVGASDNISSGESTFMVEMNETASIVNNLSKRSLIILDEIGRGTSTYDGISIAWAIAKYIHDIDYKPLTLFATHYHELNEMEKKYSRIKNFHVSIKNLGEKILFLRKLIKGGTSHSFGIHVGKMAGLPAQIINTSEKILKDLEQKKPSNKVNEIDELQLTIFDNNSSEMKEIKKILDNVDIENMTPVDSLIQLSKLKQILKN